MSTPPTSPKRSCATCGKPIAYQGRGTPRRYCSATCRPSGGRPNRRGEARRAPRLRVARVNNRRDQYDINRARAVDDAGRVAAVSDYIRSVLRANKNSVTEADQRELDRHINKIADLADRISDRSAKQAATDGNTPARRRERRNAA